MAPRDPPRRPYLGRELLPDARSFASLMQPGVGCSSASSSTNKPSSLASLTFTARH